MPKFDENNQPLHRKPRGPGKLKKAIALLEALGIDPLEQAIKEIKKKGNDPIKKANAWLKINKQIRPDAVNDIPSSPEDSVQRVNNLIEEVQKLNELPPDPRIIRSSLENKES